MAIVTNALMQGTRGRVGNMIFSTRNGKTQVRMVSERRRNRVATGAQEAVQSKFTSAINYAKYVMRTAELKALYALREAGGKRAYQLAVRDAFHAPIIRNIDIEKYHGLPGDEIYIRAVDDFMVKSVLVTIVDAEGAVLEQGDATELLPGLEWVYEAKIENAAPRGCVVRVTARDLPGNQGSDEVII